MKQVLIILFFLLTSGVMAQTDSLRLSVQDCIDLALENNIELKNSQLEIDKARATKKEAETAYFPTVTAQALAFDALNPMLSFGIDDIENAQVRQILYTLYAEYGAQLGLKKEYSFVQDGVILNAMAMQPIYAGGRIRNGNKLAKLGIEAAEYQSKIKEDEVRLQTECLYWQIIALEEKNVTLNYLDRLLDTLDRYLDGAIEAGLALPTDQYKLRVKQNESQLNRKKLNDGITLLKMALAQYIGADWQTMTLTDTLGLEMEPSAYFQIAENAVAQRNESHLLDLSLKAEDLKKKMTLGEALPSLMVGGSASYHTIFENTKPNAMVFAMLQVPITDWHKTSYKLKKHDLEAETAENTRRDLTEKMELQTNQAWFNLEQSWLRITMAQTALKDAEANLKITQDYYDAGLVALSDVLEAQTLLKQSRDELTDSRVEYRINLVTYRQLTK
ncbi:MAG: TolC family protein [Bacteroidales bacterium]|nr:TolC family protein [Bacteroidales bacterium]MBR6931532.1 TolC family protein [Bacteroidales bacterium]